MNSNEILNELKEIVQDEMLLQGMKKIVDNAVDNGWITLKDRYDENGNPIRILIGSEEYGGGRAVKWFDDDINEFNKTHEMKVALKSIPEETKKNIVDTINDIKDKFAIKNFASVSEGTLKSSYAFNITDMKHNAIRIDKKRFKDSELLKKLFNNDCDKLFHPKGLKGLDPVKSIIMHELGHSITIAGGTQEFWDEIEDIKAKHDEELGTKTYKTFKKYLNDGKLNTSNLISGYALYNKEEFVAEAFSDAMLSKTPCKYSTDVLKCIEKHFKRGGKVEQKQLSLFNSLMEVLNSMDKKSKKEKEVSEDDLWLENYGLGYPSMEEFDEWYDKQHKDDDKE